MNNKFLPLILAAAAAAYYMTRQKNTTSSSTQQRAATATTPPPQTPIIQTPPPPPAAAAPPPQIWQFLDTMKMRNDAAGQGHFGASRSGGKRKHKGVDLLVNKSQLIYAPFDGKITRKLQVYSNDPKYVGLEIQSTADPSIKVKIFYCYPNTLKIGKNVTKGEQIATAQAIADKYKPSSMQNHIHVELWKSGVNKDITPYLNL